ncbi:MAG: 3-oxoacyl-ACP reductase FabG [Clostridia bacterium]|nr:3-oxoacyl-ACP reductase FabG [Clostridia bacterium]
MKTILITGGSRGIGEAIVRLASSKYRVAFTYNTSAQRALALSQEVGAKAYKCDVSASDQVESVIAEIKRDFGGIDLLVNNAGIAQDKLFQDITDEDWRKMMGVNLDGTFFVTRAVVPGMISKGYGRIVNVSSMWGTDGASMETHYSASKAGVIGLTKALSKELAPTGITVNAVAPGAIDTDMMKTYTDEELKEFVSEIPFGRLGKPEEVAEAVMFLLSADYITGEVLSIRGGY